jgi:RNA polymerase sigma factor (sigma-70 family)
MVSRTGGSVDDASDVFQDSLIIMLEKIDNENFILSCKFKTYLYCVCENLWKTVLDKRKAASNYIAEAQLIDSEEDTSEQMDYKMYHKIFREVFESMDAGSREILNLYWKDVPQQDIADILGFTYGYVRKKKCEAQNELTLRIKQHPEYIRIMRTNNTARTIVK